ncbi:MAG: 50S ribosomal protein L25 [Anaerolineales bacterium]|nr:50S ribosomal protein L25 [Anaerolineales bacterium]
MSDIELKGKVRSAVGKGLFALRTSGKIPAVVYGPGLDALPIELEAKTTVQTLNRLTGSTLVKLSVDQKTYSVLLRDIQRDSIRRTILHADFYAVPTDRVIRVRVPLHLAGISAAVRDFSGILVPVLSDLEVECLPKDLVSGITVDLAPLEKIGDSITIKDITLPPGIRALMDADDTIVTVTAQMAEEEVVAPVAAAVPGEVEVIEKGKKLEEGEEEEGAPAPAKDAKESKEAKK